MNKNTLIGFVLIGLILFGFSWYNSKVYNEQQRAAFVADSLAAVEALKNAPKIDSAALALQEQGEMAQNAMSGSSVPVYADSLLEQSRFGQEEFYTLENNKIKVSFTIIVKVAPNKSVFTRN